MGCVQSAEESYDPNKKGYYSRTREEYSSKSRSGGRRSPIGGVPIGGGMKNIKHYFFKYHTRVIINLVVIVLSPSFCCKITSKMK